MSQLLKNLVFGDNGSFDYVVMIDGETIALAGPLDSGPTLRAVRMGQSGDVSIAHTGIAVPDFDPLTIEVDSLTTSLASPASRLQPDVYECRVDFVYSGTTYYSDPFRIAIYKHP